MVATVHSANPPSQPPPFPVRRFSVDEYHRLGETGVLTEEDQVELLEGWLVPKMIRNPIHDAAIELVQQALQSCMPGSGCRVRIQSAITTRDSEPEPDLAIIRGPVSRHKQRHPGPEDVVLVVEVADSSLARDRIKSRIYARAGISQYWILNLVDRQLEVSSDPESTSSEPAYRRQQTFQMGESVPLVIDAELGRLQVADLLP